MVTARYLCGRLRICHYRCYCIRSFKRYIKTGITIFIVPHHCCHIRIISISYKHNHYPVSQSAGRQFSCPKLLVGAFIQYHYELCSKYTGKHHISASLFIIHENPFIPPTINGFFYDIYLILKEKNLYNSWNY